MGEEQHPSKACPGCWGDGFVWVVGPDGKTPVKQTCGRCYGTGVR